MGQLGVTYHHRPLTLTFFCLHFLYICNLFENVAIEDTSLLTAWERSSNTRIASYTAKQKSFLSSSSSAADHPRKAVLKRRDHGILKKLLRPEGREAPDGRRHAGWAGLPVSIVIQRRYDEDEANRGCQAFRLRPRVQSHRTLPTTAG